MAEAIIILRHGEYTCEHHLEPLSQDGEDQMRETAAVVAKYMKEMGCKPKLTFSFSANTRAVQSAVIMSNYSGDIILKRFYRTQRDDFKNDEAHMMVVEVIRQMEQSNSDISVIIAHGVTPAVIAETVAINARGEKIELDYPNTGCGYLVDLSDGEVMQVSSEGIVPLASDEDEEDLWFDKELGVSTEGMQEIPEESWDYGDDDFPEEDDSKLEILEHEIDSWSD